MNGNTAERIVMSYLESRPSSLSLMHSALLSKLSRERINLVVASLVKRGEVELRKIIVGRGRPPVMIFPKESDYPTDQHSLKEAFQEQRAREEFEAQRETRGYFSSLQER